MDDVMPLTAPEAARRLGLTHARVRQLLATGRLSGRKWGSAWMIDPAAVEAYRQARRGNPRGVRDAQGRYAPAADCEEPTPERSMAMGGEKSAAILQLRALADECRAGDWDGAGGEPISDEAAARAEGFVRALPLEVPLPEFAPEPDGSVSLDWIQSRHRLLSLSVGPGSGLAYAWVDGYDRGHGVAHFDGTRVPARILGEIKRIVGHAATAFGTPGDR